MAPAADPALLRRRAVVDAVYGDYVALSKRLGAEDRQRLDSHLTAIQAMQKRLQGLAGPTAPPAAGCGKPAMGAQLDYKLDANMPAVGKLQMDLLAMALSCGLTNVASLQWSRAYGLSVMPFASNPGGPRIADAHHSLSHNTDAGTLAQLTAINIWYAEQFAYLIDKLKAAPDGAGTLLDNTAVLWANELGEGASHTTSNIPFVLAGKLGGALRTGRFLQYSSRPHNDLLTALANAYGVPGKTFGNPAYCTAPLPNLS
jgi:hypothetical protein